MNHQDLFQIDSHDSLETNRVHDDEPPTTQASSSSPGQPSIPVQPFARVGRSSRGCSHHKHYRDSKHVTASIKEHRTSQPTNSSTQPKNALLWRSFSSFYGKCLVLISVVLCITELVNNDIFLMQYQSFFFLYLYLGSALVIVCIYVYTIFSRPPQTTESRENLTRARDIETASTSNFGTLKKAYIKRSSTTRTSFYLRVGALIFGLATLIYTGLEISVHTTVDIPCVDEIAFVHPILQSIFTFLQMHFLFVNSQVVVEASSVVARLGFMHLVATNVAVWVQMVTLNGALEEARFSFLNKNTSSINAMQYMQIGVGTHDTILKSTLRKGKVRALYHCLNQSTLGRTWLQAVPFLYPFILQFCLLAAVIFFIMWHNVGRPFKTISTCSTHSTHRSPSSVNEAKDCRWTHKGLFLGLFVFVTTIVLLVIFYVMQVKPQLNDRLIWICLGTSTGILIFSVALCIFGLTVICKLTSTSSTPQYLDRLLASMSSFMVTLYGFLCAMSGGSLVSNHYSPQSLLLFVYGLLVVIHSGVQNALLSETVSRKCTSATQIHYKPGRQIFTALLLCNASLWLVDTFLSASPNSQLYQSIFFSPILWGFVIRITLPIVVLNRFHSTVMLYEIWKHSYG